MMAMVGCNGFRRVGKDFDLFIPVRGLPLVCPNFGSEESSEQS
jgi:hypothetical protein